MERFLYFLLAFILCNYLYNNILYFVCFFWYRFGIKYED